MMLHLKKAIPTIAAGLFLMAGTALAGTGNISDASISYYDTYKDGSIYDMNGTVALSGNNSSSSTNQLWVELYKRNNPLQPDSKITSDQLAIGTSTWTRSTTVSSSKYYIHLDPDGPNYNSCIGYGKAQN
jgi:hypothetical protein